MMTSLKFVFYHVMTCLLLEEMAQTSGQKLSTAVYQEKHFISANVGDNVTLRCFYENTESAWLFWYKQTLGQKPQLISTFYVYDAKMTFYAEFKDNVRFGMDSKNGINQLTISDLQPLDSAVYYCANSYTFILMFAEGTIVNVKDSSFNIQPKVNQLTSETVQPGDSVTLNCTVLTGTCDGEHNVYWFKESQEPGPGLIYIHGDKTNQCEKKPGTQTKTCFYNLLMNDLNVSHTGTYYCAVASCGHVVYGNGTKLKFKDENSNILVYFLSGTLTFTAALSISLALAMFKIIKRNNCQCTESPAGLTAPSTGSPEGHQDTNNLHYAAVNVKLPNRSRRQRDSSKSECVYSSLK